MVRKNKHTILKTVNSEVILSKLVYLWMLLPNPPDAFIKRLLVMCFEFVWIKKRIKRATAVHNVVQGGTGLTHIKAYIKLSKPIIVQELCESHGGRPGLSALVLVSMDVKNC